MFIDTHSHLNFSAFDKDREEIMEKSLEKNVWMINVGTNYFASKKAIDIAKGKEGIFASIGLHPINLDTGLVKIRNDELSAKENSLEKDFDYKQYAELVMSGGEKVVAIGEIGFDYWYKPKAKTKRELFKEKQRILFRKELKLAKEFELPLILHCRLGHDDLLQELSKKKHKPKGVLHCFCGSLKEAQQFIGLGYYIGLNGMIFKLNLDEAVKKIPLDKILIETDCPFLTPPKLKKKRNEPVNVKCVAEKIAKVKNIKVQEVEKITTENAISLFKL